MRLALSLVTGRPGRQGGAETNYVRNLLDRFVAHKGPEQVTLLANPEVEAAYAQRVGGPVSMWPVAGMDLSGGKAQRAACMLRATLYPRALRKSLPTDFDVIHYPIAVALPKVDKPSVVTLHDVAHLAMPQMFGRSIRLYRSMAYDGPARRADMVITISEHARESLVEYAGVDPSRVVSVRQGIDRRVFHPDDPGTDASTLDGLELPEYFIVFPANMWPHKNHDALIDALPRLDERDVSLVLTGQDYGRLTRLDERARSLGVAERVRHLGHVEASVVPALYRRAAALVFPSLYEGFGAPPLEAMACGCVVASSTGGALAEVCGDAAQLFDPRDVDAIAGSIDAVLSDVALRRRLRAEGLAHVRAFSWDDTIVRHNEVYEAAVATGR